MELQGLIPRFVTDLFATLKDNATTAHKTVVQVSFLEIYGEDVYDLISPTSASGGANSSSSSSGSSNKDRPSLPVREDETGHVFVQGQQEVDVGSARAALDVLSAGSHNRITASTAMNAGSSRSHAVFTVKLVQEILGTEGEHDVHHVASKLTFVDLAGSERIKRTGAEGQRLKEGIQINSGLFNLGQVINALADDQRLKHGLKAAHVPYRNSKLTHLLKDALGGNSQTLFLACVSPAESNESETHSTLNYAKQARNIQNKPVKNMDKHQLELRRLRYALKAWTINACKHMFGLSKSSKPLLSGSSRDSADGQDEGAAAAAAAEAAAPSSCPSAESLLLLDKRGLEDLLRPNMCLQALMVHALRA
jgi:kinesin family protein 4/21/27